MSPQTCALLPLSCLAKVHYQSGQVTGLLLHCFKMMEYDLVHQNILIRIFSSAEVYTSTLKKNYWMMMVDFQYYIQLLHAYVEEC